MEEVILKELKKAPGHIGFYYKNLVTGEEFGYREDEEFEAASVIKLPILAEVLRRVSLSQVDYAEKISIQNEEKVPGCGGLRLFAEEVEVSIQTLCSLMTALSDNTATNALIRRFGMTELNRGFADRGMQKTRVNRLLFDEKAKEAGLENLTVPKEIGALLTAVYQGNLEHDWVSQKMTEMLRLQQINHKIPGWLPEGADVAHKTGEDDGISSDVGIVYGKKPFVAVFLSNRTDVPVFEQTIRKISKNLYEEMEE